MRCCLVFSDSGMPRTPKPIGRDRTSWHNSVIVGGTRATVFLGRYLSVVTTHPPEALSYLAELRDRLLNPFPRHRLADIARNHAKKKGVLYCVPYRLGACRQADLRRAYRATAVNERARR